MKADLGASSLNRRGSNVEGKCKEAFGTNRLTRGRYCRDDADSMRQGLQNGRLNDYVGNMAERTIGMDLPVSMRVRNLYNPAKNDEYDAEEAECAPQQPTFSRIEGALQHC